MISAARTRAAPEKIGRSHLTLAARRHIRRHRPAQKLTRARRIPRCMLKSAPAKGELSCAVVPPTPLAPCLHYVLTRNPKRKSILEGGTLALLLRSLLRGTANCPLQKMQKQFRKREKVLGTVKKRLARAAPGRVFLVLIAPWPMGDRLGQSRTQARPHLRAETYAAMYNTLGQLISFPKLEILGPPD